MSYSRQWDEAGSNSETEELAEEHTVQLRLVPKKSVNAQIMAYEGKVKIRVPYEAHLTGSTVVNYQDTYKRPPFLWFGHRRRHERQSIPLKQGGIL
jgi:hypothetical protein